jgi:hypothetical protein
MKQVYLLAEVDIDLYIPIHVFDTRSEAEKYKNYLEIECSLMRYVLDREEEVLEKFEDDSSFRAEREEILDVGAKMLDDMFLVSYYNNMYTISPIDLVEEK